MKKLIIIFFIPFISKSQKNQIDTVIKTDIYESHFSKKYSNPIIVKYNLYKGGGDCDRSKFHFQNDIEIKCNDDKCYKASNYDKGHMANAEDFAYNCTYDELTFRYYNCVPQTAELNRGIWKKYEGDIRKTSQNDSLIVICYNEFKNKRINNMFIPDLCYKFVYSLTQKKFIILFSCTNTNNPVTTQISVGDLSKKYNWIYNFVK